MSKDAGPHCIYDAAMIIVSGSMQLNPEHIPTALEHLQPLLTATRAEAGNIEYGFWLDPNVPGSVHLYEEWESQSAIDSHNATPHLAAFMEVMGTLEITSIHIALHEVAKTTTIM